VQRAGSAIDFFGAVLTQAARYMEWQDLELNRLRDKIASQVSDSEYSRQLHRLRTELNLERDKLRRQTVPVLDFNVPLEDLDFDSLRQRIQELEAKHQHSLRLLEDGLSSQMNADVYVKSRAFLEEAGIFCD
jgi:hypothetical protein